MNKLTSSSLKEKLMVFFKKTKELLSKDYSIHDLKNLGSLSSSLKEKLSILMAAGKNTNHSVGSSVHPFEIRKLLPILQNLVLHHRKSLLVVLAIGLLWTFNHFVIDPYGQRIQDQIEMRPTQWSQLQSLIRLSKSSASSSPSSAFSGAVSTVSMLDEMELQKIRSSLTSRGLKPSVLRLTTDNPSRLELQISDVMFSMLLDALEELRTTWRLYPDQLSVIAGSGAGMVNVSGVLVQFGSQSAGVGR